jgi:hypothetical protein
VNRPLDLATTIISPLIFLLLTAGSVAAAEKGLWEVAREPDPPASAGESAPRPDGERQVETLEQKGGFLGYNYLANSGYGGRADEYGFLHSSPGGGLFYRSLKKESNLELEGGFLNEHDYHGDLLLDYRGDYRLHLRTESLYHNLDRELLFTPSSFATGSNDPTHGNTAVYGANQDPAQNYGVSFTQDLAEFRYRLHNFPMHLNLGYWRMVKQGTIQQRFADTAFEGTGGTSFNGAQNNIFAEARGIKHLTQEWTLGVDAHLGWLDLIYALKVRQFEDRFDTPTHLYLDRTGLDGVTLEKNAGLEQHNEDPDSRFISHTVKLHTSLAGGIVGSASYSIDQRENLSRLTDTTGVRHTTVNLQNAAGDFVYTPSKEYSLAVKYRRQELDNGNRGQVTSSDFVNSVQLVKAPIDSTKNVISANLSYRPRADLSLTGEYRGEFLQRSNVSGLPSPTTWALPENSDTHLGSLALFYRPVKGLRVNANYSFTTVDHPSYGTSFQQKHEGKLLATYTRNNSWGATANLIVRRESNNEVPHFLITSLDPLDYSAYPLLSRDRSTENANLGVWFVPFPGMTLGANYAYLHSLVDQAVLFTTVVSGSEAASDFLSRSHVYGVNASYAFDEKLDLSLMLQQVRSLAVFEPQITTFSAGNDSSGIGDATRQDTTISLLSARGEYRFTRNLSSSLEYTLRDYHEKNPAYSFYNGTVHTVFAKVAAKW